MSTSRTRLPTQASSEEGGLFQPAGAWYAIFALILVTTVLTLAGVGTLVRLGFPLGACAVGFYLYRAAPVLFVGFTWWIWFLSPGIRRVVDFTSGWVDPSPILLTPPLVTMIMGLTLLKRLSIMTKDGGLPFVFAIMAVIYSYLVGVIQAPFVSATISLLNWLPPIIFAYHILVHWQNYPKYRAITQRVFIWATLLLGMYGLIQFLFVPGWDKFWMDMSEMNSIGIPEPLKIRVFSTLNAPGPFALVLMVGLLLLLIIPQPLGFAAAGVGYLAFLVSLVRTAWLGWGVGLLSLIGSLKSNLQMRLFVIILIMAMGIIPLATMEPFSDTISSRVDSLSNVQDDHSFRARMEGYQKALDMVLAQGLGAGMGAADSKTNRFDHVLFPIGVRDSTILELMYTFGWAGAIPYVSGFVLVFINALLAKVVKFDPFAGAARAIAIGVVAQFLLGSIFLGITGVVVWVFTAFVVAAQRYYQLERQLQVQAQFQQLQSESPP